MKSEFQHQRHDIALPITFGGDRIALDIPVDGTETNDKGWKIEPLYKPQVSIGRFACNKLLLLSIRVLYSITLLYVINLSEVTISE